MVVATLIARINVLFRATGRRHQLPVVHRCKKRSRKKYKVRKRKKRGKNKKKFWKGDKNVSLNLFYFSPKNAEIAVGL